MSDTIGHVTHEYDVFIIFAGCDLKKAEHICKGLESENFRCLAQWKDGAFEPGKPVFYNIVASMRKSQSTLLILTKDSFSASWVALETILALEHSVQRGQLTLRLLLYDVQESEISFLKRGLLENIPDVTVNFNKENWQRHLADSLKKHFELPKILPVGCLAHGQVFSHFVGYLRHLLPKLEKIIEGTAIYKQKPECVSKKLCLLLPGSCKLPDTLDTEDKESGITISNTSTNLEFEEKHADKMRKINPTLYRVSKGEEEYYFIADLPNVLNAMYRIETQGLAKVDLRFQIARFYYTMNEVLNHSDNKDCANKVTLVPYNDSVEHMGDVIFQAVREEVLCQRTRAVMHCSKRTPQHLLPQQHSYPADVLIVTGDEAKDFQIANDILQYMENKNKKVILQKASYLDLDEARWVIFIISKASIISGGGLLLKCISVLVDSITNNMLRTLPVLVDIQPNELPQMIKWVTLVTIREANYRERLLQTVNGETIRVLDRLPSGDVATGLAWAYVLNYLTLTLLGKTEDGLDFRGRIQTLLQDEHLSCGCIPKLYLLVPKSCYAQPSVDEEANKGCPADVKPVQRAGALKPIKVDTGGVHKREYKFHMYKYTDPNTGQSTCFLCEYSTPIKCLYEMANNFSFAGLHKGDMYKQAEDFVHLFPTIVGREAVKSNIGDISSMVQLIYFDDEKETLLSAFKSQIKLETIDPTELVFANRLTN